MANLEDVKNVQPLANFDWDEFENGGKVEQSKEEQEKAQMIEKMDFVKFPKTKNIGPRDLNLNNTSKLVEVKAQKRGSR